MSTIKKSFEEIYSILIANSDKTVEEVMELVIPLMVSKQRDTNNYEDEDGNLYIFCYYHKEWEMVKQVEYGSKASSSTGLNTMCKIGVNSWTKQQRDFKTNKSNLLEEISEGTLQVEDLKDRMSELEEEKDKIVPLIETHWDMALIEHEDRFPTEEETEEK